MLREYKADPSSGHKGGEKMIYREDDIFIQLVNINNTLADYSYSRFRLACFTIVPQ